MNLAIKFYFKTLSRSRDNNFFILENLSHLIEIVHETVSRGTFIAPKKSCVSLMSVERLFCKILLQKLDGLFW